MKTTLLIILFLCSCCISNAQKGLRYTFDKEIMDSLDVGIELYKSKAHPNHPLNLFLLLKKDGNVIEMYLQEFSSMPKGSGFARLIEETDRSIRTGKGARLPILSDEDIFAEVVQKDNLTRIPYSGYYIKAIKSDAGYRVVETAVLF